MSSFITLLYFSSSPIYNIHNPVSPNFIHLKSVAPDFSQSCYNALFSSLRVDRSCASYNNFWTGQTVLCLIALVSFAGVWYCECLNPWLHLFATSILRAELMPFCLQRRTWATSYTLFFRHRFYLFCCINMKPGRNIIPTRQEFKIKHSSRNITITAGFVSH